MKKNKYCKYCHSHKEIRNSGDSFVLLHEEGERWHLCAASRNHFMIAKIRYCPMCGRKLKKSAEIL